MPQVPEFLLMQPSMPPSREKASRYNWKGKGLKVHLVKPYPLYKDQVHVDYSSQSLPQNDNDLGLKT